jgi:molecular chaperone Hsp33
LALSPFSSDSIRRFLFERYPVRGHVVHLDSSWRAVREHSAYPAAVQQLLGEAMVSVTLLAATLKFDGTLTLQLQGPGPVHLLVAQCTDRHAIRGVARYKDLPEATAPGHSLYSLAGEGRLSVSIASGNEPAGYQGIVPLAGASLAASLETYFANSEQLPTRLWLAAEADHAAGFLLQRVPDHERAAGLAPVAADDVDELWNRVGHLASTLTARELLDLDEARLLKRLFAEDDIRLFAPTPVFFQCRCSRERVVGILRSLGEAEVQSILDERGSVEVRCEFCNRAYAFDAVDCAGFFRATEEAQASRRLQ